MKKTVSYLHKLTFDPKLNSSWVAKYLSNPRLSILLLLLVIGFGTFSYLNLPRRLNPEVKIPLVLVSTVLPGASPADVESLVTEPLEDVLTSMNDISVITSSSQDNVSVIQVEFNSGVDPEKARTDVQAKIDQVKLPEDALDASVQALDFENQPVWTFALVGKDYASISRIAKTIKDNLEELPNIERVRTGGLEEQEISIIANPTAVSSYGLNAFQLSSLISNSLASFPAGTITTKTGEFTLAVDPIVTDIDDVRNLKLQINGEVVSLSSIAQISQRSKPHSLPTYYASGIQKPTRAVVFDVYKTGGSDIDSAVKNAEKEVEETLQPYSHSFFIKTILNTGDSINEQFTSLFRDFTLVSVLVFVVLFIFLGARQAFVSFFAVPLSFLISFTVMKVSGITLNFLSMFSLLLSLGLLVDDTIVVISAMTSYFRSGKFTPLQTGLLVWRDFIVVIITTTLTTVWAFLPLLLSGGIIGEFIKSIPIVVSSTLIASFFVAMFMTLPFMVILLKPHIPQRVSIFLRLFFLMSLLILFFFAAPKGIFLILSLIALLISVFVVVVVWYTFLGKTKDVFVQQKRKNKIVRNAPRFLDHGFISFTTIGRRYEQILERILSTKSNRRKAVVMVIIFSVFSYLLLPFGFVKNEFFPPSDEDNLYITLTLPAGTNLEKTEKEARILMEDLRQTENVSYITLDIGQGYNSGMGGASSVGTNTVLYSLTLDKNRDKSSIHIAEDLRVKYKNISEGEITVTEVSGGPPAGADIQIKLLGNDLSVLDAQADKIITFLEKQNGVIDPKKSVEPGNSKVVFIPDTSTMSSYGVSIEQIGGLLRTFASGLELDSAKITGDKDEELDITFRMAENEQKIEDIYSLSVPTSSGNVPLTTLGSFELRPNPTLISREDGQRTISVTAAVTGNVTTTEVNSALEAYADGDLNLPDGYSWKTGGVNEENQNSVNSILMAMLLSFALILTTMVIQFSSFRKAVIVMLVIPLSISGVFIIFAATGTPLSFPALIGVLALFGIVVKNSILIVDKISANEKLGMPFINGIVDATESRLEPIALTSLATIMGLIPITLSDPLWRGLGGAIIAGLVFSGTIMLFFIPVVYYMWFDPNHGKK